MLDEAQAREQIIECCRWMHERGLISGGEGNVSVLLKKGVILITPSGLNKGRLKPSDLLVADANGRVIKGKGKPSSEILVHLSAYRVRSDIRAVVHAHPPTAVALTLARIGLAQCILPESVLSLGSVALAEYATPSTEELAREVERALVTHDVVMMDRHGSVTLGQDLFQAYDRLESLEHTARITWMARLLGPLSPLPENEIVKLKRMAQAMGIKTSSLTCEQCNICDNKQTDQALIEKVVSLVLKRLSGGV